MPEFPDPRAERACQLFCDGATRKAAFREAFGVRRDSKANNSSRFFASEETQARIAEIRNRRSTLADLDAGWALINLKRIVEEDARDRVPAMGLMADIGGWKAPKRLEAEHSGKHGGPIQMEEVSDMDRARALLVLLAKVENAA